MSLLIYSLAVIGFGTLLFLVGWIAKVIYQLYIYKCDLQQFQTKENDGYALVTGSTDGIGASYAFELARRGFNLILVSRNEEKLRATTQAIQAKYPRTRIQYVRSEASSMKDSEHNIAEIAEVASKLPLKILINNVGLSCDDFIKDAVPEEIDAQINVNCRFNTHLTRALVPIMIQTGNGAIVNVASRSGIFHFPYWGIYSATKAYNIAFSHVLREELLEYGIEVLCHIPCRVVSKMSGYDKPEPGVCSSETTVCGALNAIGLRDHAGWPEHHWWIKWNALLPADYRGREYMAKGKRFHAAREVERAAARQVQSPTTHNSK